MASLFDLRSPHHAARAERWAYVRAVYTGGYLDRDTGRYVPRRSQAESDGEYAERIKVLDPDMLFSRAVGSLTGQLAAAESQIQRTWTGKGDDETAFGDVDEEGTIADRLWTDADGEGTPWAVLWRRAAQGLILNDEQYAVVSGVEAETVEVGTDAEGGPITEEVERDPRVQLVAPEAVVYVQEAAGRLVRVHILTRREADPLAGRETAQEVLTVYTLAGWQRYVRDEGSGADGEIEAEGSYEYYEDAGKRRRVLPVIRARLGLEQPVAYLLARKAASRMSMENRRDSLVNKANTPRLVHKTNNPKNEVSDELAQGSTYHQIGAEDAMQFIEPGTAGADLATRVLEDKAKAFQQAAYQTFEDQARQVTATQVREQSRAGADAFLTLLSGVVEGMENDAFFLLAQAYGLPPAAWGVPRVQRSTEFVAFDEAERADMIREAVFGPNPVPVGRTARVAAAVRWAEANGIEFDAEEVEADVDAWEAGRGAVSPGRLDALRQAIGGDGADGEAVL